MSCRFLHVNSLDIFVIQGAIPYINAHYGRGDGVNVLDGLHCTGSESSLLTCPHNGIGITPSYCDHFDDAGVECPGTISIDKQYCFVCILILM